MKWIYQSMEKDLYPDWLIRMGIRQLLSLKLKEEDRGSVEEQQKALSALVEELKKSPIAIETKAANEQHYEVPAQFFKIALGPNLKYSCALWDNAKTLGEAEEAMLKLTCQRAELSNQQEILELGCGWGSLSLFMAKQYPESKILAVSNSRTQKIYIDEQAHRRGLTNIEVQTADVTHFETERRFDRVVSVEMFEHMKNYEQLMAKIAKFLKPGGKLFVHIFSHREYAYHYENKDGNDWLTEHFFTGGIMPSDDLLLYFQKDLKLVQHWNVSGTHYEKTANAWAENMHRHRAEILPIFSETYGQDQTIKWFVYWKVFFLACAELWGFKDGQEWIVSHYQFVKPN